MGQGIWRPVSCAPIEYCMSMAYLKCLPPIMFDEECLKTSGTHARFDKGEASCSSGMLLATSNSTCAHVFLETLAVQIYRCFVVISSLHYGRCPLWE